MEGSNHLIVSELDEIAWVLNMRGNDIPYNPYFYSYLILNFEEDKYTDGVLFINNQKVTEEVGSYLKSFNISVKGYDEFYGDCLSLKGGITVDETSANSRILRELNKSGGEIKNVKSWIKKFKALKNPREL
jgi:Xaa-Pro aminopeptidase